MNTLTREEKLASFQQLTKLPGIKTGREFSAMSNKARIFIEHPHSYREWTIAGRFWCKLLKRAVSGDNGWDDGTDLGTGSLQRVFEKLTLPLRSRAHLRDYGSHEHPMLRHRSQRRRLGLDRSVPAGSPVGWAATHDRPARRP